VPIDLLATAVQARTMIAPSDAAAHIGQVATILVASAHDVSLFAHLAELCAPYGTRLEAADSIARIVL
jgi:hypothetical protein